MTQYIKGAINEMQILIGTMKCFYMISNYEQNKNK